MVNHVAQMTVANIVVAMAVAQIVLWQLEHDRNQSQQFLHRVLGNVALKLFNLRPVLVDNIRLRTLKLWDKLEDIVHFDIVTQAGEQLDRALRTIATIVSMLKVGSMPELLFYRELEDLFANGKLLVYFLLAQTKVGDVEEACLLLVVE